jgi:hypothetical protein
MTIAELKIEAMNLMVLTDENLVVANIADYYDDTNLSPYLNKMNGSINRALDRFLAEGFSIEKVVAVSTLTNTEDDITITIDLTQIADYQSIVRVSFTDGLGYYNGACDYTMEADTLLLPFQDLTVSGYVYNLIYNAELPYTTSSTLDTDTITLPTEWLRMIPYFIKGELFENDEPNLAAASMNLFNATMSRLQKKKTTYQTYLKTVHYLDEEK